MTALNKQALRQLATDAHELGIIKRYTKGIEANKRFAAIATPLTFLALLDELEAAESKCRELAAENSAIKVMNDCLSEEMRGYESDGAFEGPKMHLLWWKAETPATDAFLAEVRAGALEYYANLFKDTVNMDVKHNQEFHRGTLYVADQFRKGAAQ